jgi:hypothetical protein
MKISTWFSIRVYNLIYSSLISLKITDSVAKIAGLIDMHDAEEWVDIKTLQDELRSRNRRSLNLHQSQVRSKRNDVIIVY